MQDRRGQCKIEGGSSEGCLLFGLIGESADLSP